MKKYSIVLLIVALMASPLFASGKKEVEVQNIENSNPVKTTELVTEKKPVISTELSTLSKPVYRIELYDTVTITQQDLDERVSYVSSQLGYQVSYDEVVEDYIDTILFSQAVDKALKDGQIDVYDGEFNQFVSYQLQNFAAQYGIVLNSNESAEAFLKQLGTTYNDFANSCLTQWAQQKFIDNYSNGALDALEEPTDEEIEAFYNDNVNRFVSDEYVKIAHIFFAKAEDTKDKAEKAAEDIKNGNATFEKICNDLSEDKASSANAGILDYWIGRTDPEMIAAFGEESMNAMFSLGVGEISGAVEGTQGYHIFKCLVRKDSKILGLDDQYNPNADIPVRYVIGENLMAQKYQIAYIEITDNIIADLRSQATITSLN